jgi:hypothetical protein
LPIHVGFWFVVGKRLHLDRYKASSNLAHRANIVTFFDYYEVDEGRMP